MNDPFHKADDSDEGEAPSTEALAAAFRAARGRETSSEEANESEVSPSDRSRPVPDSSDSNQSEAADEPPSSVPSPADLVNETVAAFRKAEDKRSAPGSGGALREREDRDREEASSGREGRSGRLRDRGDTSMADREPAPSSGERDESAEANEEPATDERSDSADDFGDAVRRALSERGQLDPEDFDMALKDAGAKDAASDDEDPSEENAADPAPSSSTRPSEGEVEPVARRGDSVPPSEKVGMSAGKEAPAPSAKDSIEGFPARPDASFLWVTEEPRDDSASVSVEHLDEPRAQEADAFLLHGTGRRPYKLLTRIRGHSKMGVYLKPAFWYHPQGQKSPVARHVDGEWSREDREGFKSLQGQATAINQRIDNLVRTGGREEGGVELRVLRFMATRNHEFTPQRTVENSDGFVYPKLTPLLERGSRSGGGELAQVLSVLDERRLLTGEFVMRQHACRNCGSAFLNFEEMCPHCQATDLDADDLVHHFRCAFTGALSEYKKEEGKLVCPKCDRQLKQIGVDYDKPSVVYTCRRCHEQFQDPDVQTTCYQCEHTNAPEQQMERQVKEYEVTALGEETAIYGLSDSLLSILERESRVLDYATFQLIVESEAARIERYQRSRSSLLLVRVSGLKRLRMELGERSQEVIGEIATAFDNTLRSSDYLSARDESLYLFLLTETDQDGARRAGERLENNIEGVLGQNLQNPPELDVAVQPLRPGIDLDGLAERFLATHTRDPAAVPGR